MVIAAAKSTTDQNLELHVAAAAAAVVATTAAVGKHCENLETGFHSPSVAGECFNQSDGTQSGGEADGPGRELRGSGDREHDTSGTNPEGEREHQIHLRVAQNQMWHLMMLRIVRSHGMKLPWVIVLDLVLASALYL